MVKNETNKAATAIRRRIKERDWTQGTLAQRLGKSQAWVSSSLLVRTQETIDYLLYKQPQVFRLLLGALGWTLEQFNEETGLVISGSNSLSTEAIPETLVMVKVIGTNTQLPVSSSIARVTAQAYKMPDNSMDDGSADAIREGDWVLVDFADVTPVNGRRYLISNVKGLCVRRLLRVGDAWIWAADNIEAASLQGSAANIEGACYTVLSYRSL